jgi:hypothetical protein
MTRGDLAWKLAAGACPAAGTAHTLATMLGDPDRDHRQLFDLVARRLTQRDPLRLAKHMPASAARRPMLDELIDRPGWQQRTPMTLMTRLAARFAPRTILATPRLPLRRI